MAKSKYEELVLPKLVYIEKWIKEGETEAYVIKKLGISKRAFETYKTKHEALKALLSRARVGRDIIDIERAERALMKAVEGGWEVRGRHNIYIPPNFNAIRFALEKLAKAKYGDKTEEVNKAEEVKIILNIMDCSKNDN